MGEEDGEGGGHGWLGRVGKVKKRKEESAMVVFFSWEKRERRRERDDEQSQLNTDVVGLRFEELYRVRASE